MSRLNVMTQALDDATQRVSRYLMLQFLVNAGFGALCGLGTLFHRRPLRRIMGNRRSLIPYRSLCWIR